MALCDRQLLDSLSRTPFVDSAELAGILGKPHATVHRALADLLAPGIVGRVSHGTGHLPSSQRYYVTANGIREAAQVLGFETPSDFVRAYPVSREWLALLIRRMDAPYVLGDLIIDYAERSVTLAGRPLPLIAMEYRLLAELSSNAGRLLTYEHLLERVWGEKSSGDVRPMRTIVSKLRRKLGDDADNPILSSQSLASVTRCPRGRRRTRRRRDSAESRGRGCGDAPCVCPPCHATMPGSTASVDLQSPSHISKMVLSTIKIGPHTRDRT